MAKDKLYLKIADYLKEKIKSGKLKIGDAVYSENMLCEKFNVSRTSVRKAIRIMIEENLLVSKQGKGTFIKAPGNGVLHNSICLVNHWSRSLRLDFLDSYYSRIIYSSEESVRERDMEFQIFSRVSHLPEELLKQMSKLNFDGLIIDGAYQDYFPDLSFFRQISPNLVLVDGHPDETDIPVVTPDVEDGYRQLLPLVKQRGGSVAFVYHEHQVLQRRRLTGIQNVARELNIDIEYINYGQNTSYDNFFNVGRYRIDHYPLVYRALKPWLNKQNYGGTILCSCDHTALKVLQILNKNGFQVPDDFAIAGFGGHELSMLAPTDLTTIKVDSEQLAVMASDYLWDIINGNINLTEHCRMLPVILQKRNSL